MCQSQRWSIIPRLLRNGVGTLIFSSSPLKKELGMRRTVVLLLSTAVALLFAGGVVLALPSERADKTPMVNGSKDDIYCGPGADRVEANPGDTVTKGCEKVQRAGKRVG
jgi:hypothetical protein